MAGGCYVDPVYQYSGQGTIKSAVFMRSEACVDGSRILVTLSARSTVSVIGFTDGWFYIESNGARGWVGQQFVDTAATRSTVVWDSYQEFMDAYPSRASYPSPTQEPAPAETAYTG